MELVLRTVECSFLKSITLKLKVCYRYFILFTLSFSLLLSALIVMLKHWPKVYKHSVIYDQYHDNLSLLNHVLEVMIMYSILLLLFMYQGIPLYTITINITNLTLQMKKKKNTLNFFKTKMWIGGGLTLPPFKVSLGS